MLRCREASLLVSKGLDARLTLREQIGLRLHLLLCGACARYRRQIILLRTVLSRELERLPDLVRLEGLRLTAEEQASVLKAMRAAGPQSDG